jgi:hypothetical protein
VKAPAREPRIPAAEQTPLPPSDGPNAAETDQTRRRRRRRGPRGGSRPGNGGTTEPTG